MFRYFERYKEMLESLERAKMRAGWLGYDRLDGRNVGGKLRSFKQALRNSYQAEWITLDKGEENERRWRCLINASRLTENFDKKVISIEYDSGVEEGTVFYWDRTNMYWIVNLQQHTEEAYFRGIITRCDYIMDINGKDYWISVRGPVETTTQWNEKHNWNWNKLNYSLMVEIKKDSNTVEYFSRHKVVKMKLMYADANTGEQLEEWHNWKVVATDKYSEEKIMQVYLDEWYDNPMENAMAETQVEDHEAGTPHIEGPQIVHAFDENLLYSIVGITNGKFVVNSNKVKIISMDENSCVIDILSSKATEFTLSFVGDNGDRVDQVIKVQSI